MTRQRPLSRDGKTLRRAYEKDDKPLHLVSAFAAENRLAFSQQAVDEKSNEITTIPELLRALDVKKATITIDAMGCQKEIAAQIREQKADDVLALKENQPTLHADVQELFLDGMEDDLAGMKHQEHETREKGHGRQKTRMYHLIHPTAEWLARHPEWKDLRKAGMVCSKLQIGDATATGKVRFFITSLSLRVTEFAHAARGHWAIENNLHWTLDVGLREDESRSRKDHTATNLAWIRRMAASLLAQDGTKAGILCKRKIAGWDDDFLLSITGRAVA